MPPGVHACDLCALCVPAQDCSDFIRMTNRKAFEAALLRWCPVATHVRVHTRVSGKTRVRKVLQTDKAQPPPSAYWLITWGFTRDVAWQKSTSAGLLLVLLSGIAQRYGFCWCTFPPVSAPGHCLDRPWFPPGEGLHFVFSCKGALQKSRYSSHLTTLCYLTASFLLDIPSKDTAVGHYV